jgi:FkbM family methyltransferase
MQRDYDIQAFPLARSFQLYAQQLHANGKKPLIIDAGANIGASALYFHLTYPEAEILAIEPDLGNGALFRLNCNHISTISLIEGGIASRDGFMALQDPGLSDWGFRLAPATAGERCVPVHAAGRLLAEKEREGLAPLIVKVDIEGGESELFAQDTAWLSSVPLLIIELHDWMLPGLGNSRNFLQAVSRCNFDFLCRGENVFCFNNELLKPLPET